MRVQGNILPLFLLAASIDALPSFRREVTHAADVAASADAGMHKEVSTFKYVTPRSIGKHNHMADHLGHGRRGLARRQPQGRQYRQPVRVYSSTTLTTSTATATTSCTSTAETGYVEPTKIVDPPVGYRSGAGFSSGTGGNFDDRGSENINHAAGGSSGGSISYAETEGSFSSIEGSRGFGGLTVISDETQQQNTGGDHGSSGTGRSGYIPSNPSGGYVNGGLGDESRSTPRGGSYGENIAGQEVYGTKNDALSGQIRGGYGSGPLNPSPYGMRGDDSGVNTQSGRDGDGRPRDIYSHDRRGRGRGVNKGSASEQESNDSDATTNGSSAGGSSGGYTQSDQDNSSSGGSVSGSDNAESEGASTGTGSGGYKTGDSETSQGGSSTDENSGSNITPEIPTGSDEEGYTGTGGSTSQEGTANDQSGGSVIGSDDSGNNNNNNQYPSNDENSGNESSSSNEGNTAEFPSESSTCGVAAAAPEKLQEKIIEGCLSYLPVEEGMNCERIISANPSLNLDLAAIRKLNPSINAECTNMWGGGANICTSACIGGQRFPLAGPSGGKYANAAPLPAPPTSGLTTPGYRAVRDRRPAPRPRYD